MKDRVGVAGVGRDFLGGSLRRRQETSKRAGQTMRRGQFPVSAPIYAALRRYVPAVSRGTLTLAITYPFTARDEWKRRARKKTVKRCPGHVRTYYKPTDDPFQMHILHRWSLAGQSGQRSQTRRGGPTGSKGAAQNPTYLHQKGLDLNENSPTSHQPGPHNSLT